MNKDSGSAERRRGALAILAAAFMFYSRIPMPHSTPHDRQTLTRAAALLPLVGFVVGSISALLGFAAALVLPGGFAVVLAMSIGVLLTGAFHEDGLADTVDGLGGGWTTEQKLEIMKDSRSGAYAVIATVLQQLAVFNLLVAMEAPVRWVFLAIAHIASRVGPMFVMLAADYLRTDKPNKVGGAVGRQPFRRVIMTVALGLALVVPAVLLGVSTVTLGLVFAAVIAVSLVATAHLRRKLGGYTGDTLGAVQQVCFTTCLVTLIV